MEENTQSAQVPQTQSQGAQVQGGTDLTKLEKLPYEAFIKALGEGANDPKLKAAIASGLKDNNKEDDVFDFTVEIGIPVRGCKPTQSEVVVDKSLSFPLTSTDKGSLETLLTSGKGKSYTAGGPIVVFSDGTTNYVIDGHHRWSQVHVVNPDAFITGMVMTSKVAMDAKEVLKAVQMAILKVVQDNAPGAELPEAKGAGNNPEANLFECSEESLKKYVAEKAGKDFLDVAKEVGKIEEANVESAGDYIWKNVLDLRKNSSPIEGATKRELMPQTDGADNLKDGKATAALKAGKWRDELISGVINHATPFESKKWIRTFEQFKGNR
jgi:hypothetical protein